MESPRTAWRLMMFGSVLGMFGAMWGIGEVLLGNWGVEDLFFALPALLACLTMIFILLRSPGPRDSSQVSPTSDPSTAARKRRHMLAFGLTTATALTLGYTVVWVVRSGTLWMPVLVGGIALAVTWTVMVVILRPKAER